MRRRCSRLPPQDPHHELSGHDLSLQTVLYLEVVLDSRNEVIRRVVDYLKS